MPKLSRELLFYTSCFLISTLALVTYCTDPNLGKVEAIIISLGGTTVFAFWAAVMLPLLLAPHREDESDSEPPEVESTSDSDQSLSSSSEETEAAPVADSPRRSPRRFFPKKCQHCGSC